MKNILIVLTFLILPVSACAAELTIVPPLGPVHAGDTFTVDVVLNPADTEVNALEGVIAVSSGLEIRSVRTNASVVPLWAEGPSLSGNTVSFAGVIPGGYLGSLGSGWVGYRPDVALTLLITARASGAAAVSFKSARVLANDGNGTELPLKALGLDLSVLPSNGRRSAPTIVVDTEKPEPFSVLITDGAAFGAKNPVMVFSAVDKDSGIERYEIAHFRNLLKEEDTDGLSWSEAESPYVLKDSEVGTYHYVRAIDEYGNTRVAVAAPVESARTQAFWWIMLIGALLAAGFLVFRMFKRSA
jgi:hypothetical protein